jgi:hypothetical protein
VMCVPGIQPPPRDREGRLAASPPTGHRVCRQAAIVTDVTHGLFPHTFCRILPDLYGADPEKCVLSHSDGAGTKAIVAYILYRTTGDASAFRKIAHDAVVMNLDDMVCAGAVRRENGFTPINGRPGFGRLQQHH